MIGKMFVVFEDAFGVFSLQRGYVPEKRQQRDGLIVRRAADLHDVRHGRIEAIRPENMGGQPSFLMYSGYFRKAFAPLITTSERCSGQRISTRANGAN